MDETKVVHMFGQARIKLADPKAVLPLLLEFVGAGHQLVFAAVKNICKLCRRDRLADRIRNRFTVEFLQLGLVVEGIDVRRPAHHKQKNNRLGPWHEMRFARAEGIEGVDERRRFGCRGLSLQPPKSAQGERAKSGPHSAQKVAPRAVARTGEHSNSILFSARKGKREL